MTQSKLEKILEDFRQSGFDPNEEDRFTDFAIIYEMDGGKKKKIGPGILRVIKNKENKRTRVVMRTKDCSKVLLNHYILPNITYEDEVTELLYTTTDFAEGEKGKEMKICFMFPEERDTAMNDFITAFEEGQKSNQALLC